MEEPDITESPLTRLFASRLEQALQDMTMEIENAMATSRDDLTSAPTAENLRKVRDRIDAAQRVLEVAAERFVVLRDGARRLRGDVVGHPNWKTLR